MLSSHMTDGLTSNSGLIQFAIKKSGVSYNESCFGRPEGCKEKSGPFEPICVFTPKCVQTESSKQLKIF